MEQLIDDSVRNKVKKKLRNKVILVTGGTGSFGKTIVSELIHYGPAEIRIFSRSEDKQDNMRFQYRVAKQLRFVLGDVRDKKQLDRAMTGVHIVFHAAAQKQVPASEYNVLEAVKTNILGAQNVIDACFAHHVEHAIAISTDKAVEPVNAMGMTKAIQEKLFISANCERYRGNCTFSCVRYGNVIGSTGSVLEVFLKQLSKREKLSITDSRMTRFLITLDQAVDLVFIALVQSVGGEIFVPEIPSHTIVQLAESLKNVYMKKNIGNTVKIEKIGIRVGEKIHETLISPTESLMTIKKNHYYVILPQIRIPEIERKYTVIKNTEPYRYASDTAKNIEPDTLEKILLRHIPN